MNKDLLLDVIETLKEASANPVRSTVTVHEKYLGNLTAHNHTEVEFGLLVEANMGVVIASCLLFPEEESGKTCKKTFCMRQESWDCISKIADNLDLPRNKVVDHALASYTLDMRTLQALKEVQG